MKRQADFSWIALVAMIAAASLLPAAAQAQYKEVKITALDGDAGDNFGNSVDISGGTAIVGARGDGDQRGAAYLFDTFGAELFKLTASDAAVGDLFSTSVGISGNVAIVGAPSSDDAGFSSGSAYLFDVTTGNQLFKLTAADDAASQDHFGISVGISGDVAIVGAQGGGGNPGNYAGSAYLFDVTTGNQLFKLTASDAASLDYFGYSVGISGDWAIVGAYGHDNQAGSAYLFDVKTGNQTAKLTPSNAAESDQFGLSVGISGDRVVVGRKTPALRLVQPTYSIPAARSCVSFPPPQRTKVLVTP